MHIGPVDKLIHVFIIWLIGLLTQSFLSIPSDPRSEDSLAVIDNAVCLLIVTTDYTYNYESNNFLIFISIQPIILLLISWLLIQLSEPLLSWFVTDVRVSEWVRHILCAGWNTEARATQWNHVPFKIRSKPLVKVNTYYNIHW